MRLHFAIDFDGTVALQDTTDALLGRFADPAWLTVEEEWLGGQIGSRECLARQAALTRATAKEIDAFLADIAIDRDFAAFAVMARSLGATMEIISDGFDRCILPLLDRAGLRLPVTCNRLRPLGDDRWIAEFPASSLDCRSGSGVCKCRSAQPGRLVVLIGDGRSDFCLASRADFVLAKNKLAVHCAERKYPFQTITCFADAVNWLRTFLAEPACEVSFCP